MNRRSFLKYLGLGAAGAAVAVLPVPVPTPKLATMQPKSPLEGGPSFTFASDSDTGIYITDDNKIGFTT